MSQETDRRDEANALLRYFKHIRRLPGNLRRSIRRYGTSGTGRSRSQRIFSNLFLHFHPVKVHRHSLRWNYTYGLGVMSIGLFIILAVTGLLLMLYYEPSVDKAYDSMKDIHYVVPAGRLVRNVHRWAAHLMVLCVFLHMARVFFTGAYKKGREFNWVVGIVLLAFTLGLSYTGYLLPWDQLAYWAVTIGANIAASPRELTDALGITQTIDIGGMMKTLLLGSETIGNSALVRFYFLHCVLLPVGTTLLIAVHIWRVRKDGGLSRPSEIDPAVLEGLPESPMADTARDDADKPRYSLVAVAPGTARATHPPEETVEAIPHAFVRELTAFMFILAVTMVLAYLFDAPLKEAANPAVPENPAKAPWYFLGLQELVGYSAFMGGVVIPGVAMLGLALIPYLDRRDTRIGHWFTDRSGSWVALWSLLIATVSCVLLLWITVDHGWLRTWYPDISQWVIILCNPGTILVTVFALWSLAVIRRTNSIRHGAIALFACFLVSFTILTYFATVHRGPNWEFYWWPSQWPSH